MNPLVAQLVYALAWAAFGASHSGLARDALKVRLRRVFGPWTRLVYNGIAVVVLGAVWAVGWYAFDGGHGLDLLGWARHVMVPAEIVGWVALAAALAGYDLGRLAGTRQVRAHRAGIVEPEDEDLRTDGLNRWVRHPAYAAGFLILWGHVTTDFELATAIWGSLYLVIGARFEERSLLARYGAAYAEYRRKVPAFLPWKGRAI